MAEHVHEVMVGEDVIMTGPPITQAGEEPEELEAIDIDSGGQLPGKTVAAANRKSSANIAEVEAEEARQVAAAGSNPDKLPSYARDIWRRMFHSGKRYSGDATYSAMVAWRAVRKRYGLIPEPTPAAKRRAPNRTKSLFANVISRQDAGSVVVKIGDEDATKYQKQMRVDLDMVPGVAAMVGVLASNRRAITSVIVPKRLISDDPGGAGAIKWVRRHWAWIWKHAMGQMGAMRTVGAKVDAADSLLSRLAHRQYELKRFHGGRNSDGGVHFVTDPKHAVKRVAYGIIYPPYWVDHQGEYADEPQVEEMAHRFMKQKGQPGLMHAAWPVGEIVESYVTRRGDPDFIPGAWVGATEYPQKVWQKVMNGELRGYSMGGGWDGHFITGLN